MLAGRNPAHILFLFFTLFMHLESAAENPQTISDRFQIPDAMTARAVYSLNGTWDIAPIMQG